MFVFQEHTSNQEYKNYIQPTNQNLFKIISEKIGDEDWHKKSILDYGCNIGNLLGSSEGIIRQENYTGVDVQQKPLSIAKDRYPDASWFHFNGYHPAFNPTGTCKFPTLDKKFDVIVCIGVFNHCDMDTIKSHIEYFKSILAHGGKIVFSLWEDIHYEQYAKVFLKKIGIVVENNIFVPYQKSKYLIDRKYTVEDKNNLPVGECKWVETFYKREYILSELTGAELAPGENLRHSFYTL